MKRTLRSSILSLILLASEFQITYTQEINYISIPVNLSQYLSGVMKGNLDYIAGQFNVSIAEAELKAAKVFPDPGVSLAYSNNEDRSLRMGQSFEAGMSYPVSLGNKRGAGILLARSQYELSQLMLEAFFKNLRADAALSYFAGLRNHKIYLLQEDIYKQLAGLASADSIRLKTGEVAALDALQSSLAARSQITEVYQSFAEMHNSQFNLLLLQGKVFHDTLMQPSDDFPYQQRMFNLNELIKSAIENRAELLAAIKNKEVSDKNLRLLKASRAFEFNVETGYSYNSIVRNEIAPAPAYIGLSAGLAFPLKFSNLNRGLVQAAELAQKKSNTIYEQTELQITAEVVQAYNNYLAQDRKIGQFDRGLVNDAYKILQGRVYSYQHGESGLIDVLNAQRTYTELQLNYLEAMFEYTAALIELERAAGIWDLSE
jgi:cobalt-zinc-cadmium efflux system outer membrane protein